MGARFRLLGDVEVHLMSGRSTPVMPVSGASWPLFWST